MKLKSLHRFEQLYKKVSGFQVYDQTAIIPQSGVSKKARSGLKKNKSNGFHEKAFQQVHINRSTLKASGYCSKFSVSTN